MQPTLAFLVLAIAQPPPQDAEQWFRAMESKIVTANALKLICQSSVEDGPKVYRVDVKLWAAQGNRLRVEAVPGLGPAKDKEIVIVADGKQTAVLLSPKEEPLMRDLDPEFNKKVLGLLVRTAMGTFLNELLRPGTQLKAGEIELTKFKLGAKEKADNKREAQLIEFECAIKEKVGVLKVKLWIDTNTLLPLRRVLTITTGGAEARYTEVYREFTLDPPIDAKLFVLPQ
jgi:outer membrane lipoprotein-sorting protein